MTTTTHGQVPEALRIADEFRECLECDAIPSINDIEKAEAELRRLHAYCQELEAHVILDCMTHVQNPAKNEHVAGDVSKNGAELNTTQQPAPDYEAGWKDGYKHGAWSAQQPAPATQHAGEVVAYLDIGAGGYLDLGTDLADEALLCLPKGRHALIIAGTYGIDGLAY